MTSAFPSLFISSDFTSERTVAFVEITFCDLKLVSPTFSYHAIFLSEYDPETISKSPSLSISIEQIARNCRTDF